MYFYAFMDGLLVFL